MSNKAKLLASAQKSLQKGQVAKAIKDFQKIVEIDPKDIRTRQKLAELYSRANQTENALLEYEAVAKYYSENGFYLKAIAVYKQMQKIDASQVRIYHRLAELNEKQGLLGNALSEYRSLVSHYEQHQMTSEAVNVLLKMKELEPENLNVLVKIAESYARTGMKDKAKEEFQEVIERLEQKSDFSKILKLCDMFMPFFPGDPEALLRKADALINSNEPDKGIAVLQEVLKSNAEDESVLRALAKGYRKAGDFGNERLTCQQLLKGNTENLELRQALIQSCLDGQEFERALEELEEWKDSFFEAELIGPLKGYYEILQEKMPGQDPVVKTLHAIYEVSGDGDKLFDLMSSVEDGPTEGPASFEEELETLDDSLLGESVNDLEELELPEEFPKTEEVPVEAAEPKPAEQEEGELEELDLEEAEVEEATTDAAVETSAEESGEVPLEFLEGMAEDTPEAEIEEPPQVDEPVVNVAGKTTEDEIELELELDLDLDEEIALPASVESAETASADDESDEPDPVEDADVIDEGIASEPLEEVLEDAQVEELEPVEEAEVLESSEPTEEPEILEEPEVIEASALPDEPAEPEPEQIDVSARLEEATFYLQQGLLDEAEAICREVLQFDAVCVDAQTKLAEIGQKREELAAPPSAEPEIVAEIIPEEADLDWDDALKEIQGDTVGTIEPEDAESHYNLGIAYKEMGLIDDAIKEFDTAMGHPSRRLDALSLKALCLTETGKHEAAEEAFKLGLAYPGLGQEERLNLTFEIGQLKERTGALEEALECFHKVADSDHFYREVGVRIKKLREQLGLPEEGLSGSSDEAGSKKKVSYL